MKKLVISKVNDLKLRNKLIFSFILVVFVPILLVGLLLTSELKSIALANALEQTSSDMTRIKIRISESLTPPVYISNSLLVDQSLKEIATKQYETIFEVVEAYRNFVYFQNSTRFYREINNIRFYVNNDTMLNNWRFIPVNEKVRNTSWYVEAVENKGLLSWRFEEDQLTGGSKKLTLNRVIHFPEHQSFGVLVVDVNTSYMNFILTQEMMPILVLDSQNYIVATNRSELLGVNLEEVTLSTRLANGETGTFEDVAFNEPSHIMVENIGVANSANDLRIASIISEAQIMEGANRLVRLGFFVISFSMLIAVILIFGVSHLISKRISILSKEIRKVSAGDLNSYVNIQGKDELGMLSSQFNNMMRSIQELLKEIEQNNREKNALVKRQSEIKLKMLASQINPHFLFNTLETIRMKTLLIGEKEIAHIVKRLGKLLRISIEVGGSMVTLKQEMEMVNAYLEIQNFRFDERLEYDLLIDPAVNRVMIPPLIIQPLVENAVIHGLENHPDGGKIIVEAKMTRENIIISVMDNGVGISEQKKEEIFHTLSATDEKVEDRIGLRNVHERILLTYNTSQGLLIQSNHLKGTKISFMIPLSHIDNNE
ncbi:sensor histidine kinase [Evansella sp. AB-rgal1]|uniref:sensor histidine kinase n=1 Tax=Evansella sp. AB-rgal1 TaxID=3242696 RepID=UPI00359D214C